LAVPLFRAILATVFDLVAKVMDWLIAHAFKLGLGAGAFVIVAALVLIILTLIRQLLWSSRIVEATRELELCLLVPGPFGVVTHARASIDGVPVLLSRRRVELDIASPRPLIIGSRELKTIVQGDTSDGLVGVLAAKNAAREAAARLLQLGAHIEITPTRTRIHRVPARGGVAAARAALVLVRAGTLVRGATSTTVCPYCKDQIAPRDSEGSIRCPSCDAVHHTTCWQSHGGCSVHGCGRSPAERARTG